MARLLWEKKRGFESLAPGDVARTHGKAGVCPAAMAVTGKLTWIGPNFPAGKYGPGTPLLFYVQFLVFSAEVTLSFLFL